MNGGTTGKGHITALVHTDAGRVRTNGRKVCAQCVHCATHTHIACSTVQVGTRKGFYFIYILGIRLPQRVSEASAKKYFRFMCFRILGRKVPRESFRPFFLFFYEQLTLICEAFKPVARLTFGHILSASATSASAKSAPATAAESTSATTAEAATSVKATAARRLAERALLTAFAVVAVVKRTVIFAVFSVGIRVAVTFRSRVTVISGRSVRVAKRARRPVISEAEVIAVVRTPSGIPPSERLRRSVAESITPSVR